MLTRVVRDLKVSKFSFDLYVLLHYRHPQIHHCCPTQHDCDAQISAGSTGNFSMPRNMRNHHEIVDIWKHGQNTGIIYTKISINMMICAHYFIETPSSLRFPDQSVISQVSWDLIWSYHLRPSIMSAPESIHVHHGIYSMIQCIPGIMQTVRTLFCWGKVPTDDFTHIVQDYFTGTGASIWLMIHAVVCLSYLWKNAAA